MSNPFPGYGLCYCNYMSLAILDRCFLTNVDGRILSLILFIRMEKSFVIKSPLHETQRPKIKYNDSKHFITRLRHNMCKYLRCSIKSFIELFLAK